MKNKIITTALFIACFAMNIFAQTCLPSIQWQKSFGGSNFDGAYYQASQQTTDGGYIVVGQTNSSDGDATGNHGGYDGLVVKTDANGNIIWEKMYGGTATDELECMQQTADGGYIVGGTSNSTNGDIRATHGGYDDFAIKLGTNGDTVWSKTYGGSNTEYFNGVRQTSDGGYIFGGYGSSADGDFLNNHGGNDFEVVKIDANGNKVFATALGGPGDEAAYMINTTSDGGSIIAGESNANGGEVTGNHGGYDYWVVKLDGSGNINWAKSYGGSGNDIPLRAEQTSDGGYIVVGYTNSNDGDVTGNHGLNDSWVLKLDPNGNLVWQKTLGGTANDAATTVQQTSDGGYIVAGGAGSNDDDVSGNHGGAYDEWIVKLDGSGNLKWQKCFGGTGDDQAWTITTTSDNGYIVGGFSNSNDGDVSGNHGDYDFWLVKLSPEMIPAITPSGTVTVCSGTSVVLTANSGSGISYQWIKGATNISGATNQTYSAKKAANYKVKETNTAGCSTTSSATTLNVLTSPTATITPLGNLDICSTGSVVLQANSGAGYTYQWKKGSNNISGATNQNCTATKKATYKVIVTASNGCSKTSAGTKVTSSCKEEQLETLNESLSVYPNPSAGIFRVEANFDNTFVQTVTVEVKNIFGEEVYQQTFPVSSLHFTEQIHLENVNAGVYTVTINASQQMRTQKILIQ
ncbi:MAG TPA: T9SS type A sorting domain-containing protein [Chitinophagales bacterium]|nr:T9SS type A sorting domain-containing protein [Chitinophagales bacterium]